MEPTIEEAKARLAIAADALASSMGSLQHDMWTGDRFDVAPTRVDEARRLRAAHPDNWSGRDLDYIMFKCMTTMGGEATFYFVLPRFLRVVAADPYAGWTSQSHVLLSKLGMIDVSRFKAAKIAALSSALIAFAELEQAVEGDAPSTDAVKLIERARQMTAGK